MVKTKVIISCAFTAQLICAFIFAYACCWFSLAVSHFYLFYLLYFVVVFVVCVCLFFF